jgi:DNA-binding GntR family transcriptional regulator
MVAKTKTDGEKFWQKFSRNATPGLPKYVQLRDCILAAIRQGYWKRGDRLPTEMDLARITKLSLGTVQNAYRDLVKEGNVERRKGRAGSFVSREVRSVDTVWHFLFTDDRHEQFFDVFPQVDRILRHEGQGSWNLHLRWVKDEVVQIDRIVDVGRKFLLFSQFFFDAREYDRARKGRTKPLEGNNLRRELGINVTHITYDLRMEEIPSAICRKMTIPVKSMGLVVECCGHSNPTEQGYFQRIYLPATHFWLRIASNTSGAAKRALPAELEELLH